MERAWPDVFVIYMVYTHLLSSVTFNLAKGVKVNKNWILQGKTMHVEKHRISLYGRQFRKFEKVTLEKLLISRKREINKEREKNLCQFVRSESIHHSTSPVPASSSSYAAAAEDDLRRWLITSFPSFFFSLFFASLISSPKNFGGDSTGMFLHSTCKTGKKDSRHAPFRIKKRISRWRRFHWKNFLFKMSKFQ